MLYRASLASDIPALARIRASVWGSVPYWEHRVFQYLGAALSPQQALASRICYVAVDQAAGQDSVVGFVAGHLTRRHGCDGELEWINVIPEQRGKSVASELLRLLAGWFVEQNAFRVCVDVEPSNAVARAFYRRHGAEDLHPHWLVWNDVRAILDPPTPLPAPQ